MRNKIIILCVLFLLVGAGCFFAGLKYGQRNNQQNFSGNFFKGSNINQQAAGGNEMRRRLSQPNNIVVGEIIKKEEGSLVIKLKDGGSKIILFSQDVPIMRMASSTVDQLQSGVNIMVTGTQNEDGSFSAESIQIRPAGGGLKNF